MKIVIPLYILSLASLVTAILLVVYNPESNRMFLISGALTTLGLLLNIISFALKKEGKLGVK